MPRNVKAAPMVPYASHYNATYGWHLFPARVETKSSWLKASRAPEHLNWGMTADPERLIKNFSDPRYCAVCGIGLPTGEFNDLFVLEIDTKQGHGVNGAASLASLEKRYGKLPVTLMARSPSGSLHYYFNHPGRKVWSSASKLGAGIDVRGDGGMVVAPPSMRKDGEYVWHNDEEIADAPDWLLDLVTVSASGRASATTNGSYATNGDDENAADDDPYLAFAHEQFIGESIDIEELLDNISYRGSNKGGNVHDTERDVTSSLLARGEPVEDVIAFVLREVRARVVLPKGEKWDWEVERREIRDLCVDWLIKKPDVLEQQETIPPWLAKKLNGHAPHRDEPQQQTEAPPQPEPVKEIAWPVMHDDALHGVTGEVVRLIAPQTEADPNAILVQFLTYFGNMIGRDHYYQVDRSHHHANLFTLIVGDTSKARKGTSADWVCDLMARVDKEWTEKGVKEGLSSGEGMIYDIRDDAVTIDAQGNAVLGMARDKRRLFDEREFSRVLAVMRREGNTLSQIIRNAWDGRRLSTLTKAPIVSNGAHISIVGQITIDELKHDLDATSMANGYANRFLFVGIKRAQVLPYGGNVSDAALDAIGKKISDSFLKIWMVEKRVEFDKPAHALWGKIYEELSTARPGLVGAVTARSEAQVIRLAMIYAALDGSSEIRVVHLKAALAVWNYCETSVRVIFGESVGDAIADTILERLRDDPRGMNRSDIHGVFGRHVSGVTISNAMALLHKRGLVRKTLIKTKGRSAETWFST